MSSGQSKLSKQQLATTNAIGSQANQNAQSIYGNLQPFYQQEMTNPGAVAAPAITASGQSLAGSVAGAKEAGDLTAARTRNPAGLASNLDEAVREGGRQQSTNTSNIIAGTQQAGAAGNQSLYGTNVGETGSMYGLGPSTIKAGQVPTWWQNLLGAANQGGNTAANMAGAGMFG
jgi:hypothetical protein